MGQLSGVLSSQCAGFRSFVLSLDRFSFTCPVFCPLEQQKGILRMYLYRSALDAPLEMHRPDAHGYACDYLGGDSGLALHALDYVLQGELAEHVVFLHTPTGRFVPALQVGTPSRCFLGGDWRQAQADLVLFHESDGTFIFYDVLAVLQAGHVTPRAAIAAGYIGDAVRTLRGYVQPLDYATVEEAQCVLLLVKGGATQRVT